METNKILSADILDIIFEGKNKEYGAYDLRKTYNKRIGTALLITLAIAALIFIASFIFRNFVDTEAPKEVVVKDLTLEEVKQDAPPPPPPPPKLPPPPPIKTIQFTPPKIVKDEEVIKPPPPQEEIKKAVISTVTHEGTEDVGVVAPPIQAPVVEAPPARVEDEDKVFTKVEIEAVFPGGEGGWVRYVKRAIEANMDELTEAGESGTVRIRFIVDKEGNVSEVEAIGAMKNSKLAEISKAAVRKGPKWTPAQQNGRYVKAYREQPVTFTIQE
ncbi:energy transducer TonB [soil metagenome]